MALLFLLAIVACVRTPLHLEATRRATVDFFRSFDRASLKICWNTFQIISAISQSSSVNYPEPFSSWLQNLSFMSFDFFSSDCLFLHQSYFRKVYITGFLPLIFAALIVIGCAVWANMRSRLRKEMWKTYIPYALLVLSCKLVQLPNHREIKLWFDKRKNFACTVAKKIQIAHSLQSRQNFSFHWIAYISMALSTFGRTPASIANHPTSTTLRQLRAFSSLFTSACRWCGLS